MIVIADSFVVCLYEAIVAAIVAAIVGATCCVDRSPRVNTPQGSFTACGLTCEQPRWNRPTRVEN